MTYIEMCNKKDRSQGSFSRRDSKGNGFPRSLVAVRGAGGGGGREGGGCSAGQRLTVSWTEHMKGGARCLILP